MLAAGGVSEGFLQSGRYESVAHVEWERPMVETLRNRLIQKWGRCQDEAQKEVIHFDIQKTDELVNGNWSEESQNTYGSLNHSSIIEGGLRSLVGKRHINLIIGGPPCQAYSIHGRATDQNSMQDDYRNYLFESFCKVVDCFKPDVFVFENVKGLLSAKPGGTSVKNRIFEAFSEIGYEMLPPEQLGSAVYDAKEFLVPQSRPRVIIVGVRKDSNLQLDEFYNAIFAEKSDKILTVKGKIYPFKRKKRYARYPDFKRDGVIADAKYKHLIRKSGNGDRVQEGLDRDDLNQMISYLHITSSDVGIFISPTIINVMNPETGEFYKDADFVIRKDKLFAYRVGELDGYGGEIFIMGVNVPWSVESYADFVSAMQKTEDVLLQSINKIIGVPLMESS